MTVSEPVPLVFVPADGAVCVAVTKVGGQPLWLEEPQWPLSRQTGRPMEFLGQFALDGGRLAYLFMTSDDQVDNTWQPEGGENALLIQPGGRVPDFVTVERRVEGPSCGTDQVPRAAGVSGEAEGDAGEDRRPWQYLGGPGVEPHWLQGDQTPGEGWELVVQLDAGNLPYHFAFGDAGVGYAFASPDGKEGRFLWQCT